MRMTTRPAVGAPDALFCVGDGMNLLDLFLLAILAYCLIRGVFRGLIKELAAIVGVLAAFYAGYTYYPLVAGVLDRWIADGGYRNIAGFFLLFCTVFIAVSILGVVLKYLLNIAFLGWVDRICGAAFGALKGALIVSVVLVTLTAFLQKGSPLMTGSILAPHVLVVSEKMAKVVPVEMKAAFYEGIAALKQAWR
jgi:membrane protein required for colicin V production